MWLSDQRPWRHYFSTVVLAGATLGSCASSHDPNEGIEVFNDLAVVACDCEESVSPESECTGTAFRTDCVRRLLGDAPSSASQCALGIADALHGCLSDAECGRAIGCQPNPTALGASRRPEDVAVLTDVCSASEREFASELFAECRL